MTALLAQIDVIEKISRHAFYQHALLGGLAVAVLCGTLSVLVVLKRMSFIGEGVAHAAFGGFGVALLAGVFFAVARGVLVRDAIVAVFCVGAALAIGFISRRGRLNEDASIGIILVVSMAIGLVLLNVREVVLGKMIAGGQLTRGQVGYTISFHEILFGNIFYMRVQDVYVAWALAAVTVALVAAFFKELVFFTFDEETAAVFGVRTSVVYYGLLLLLGLAVVEALRTLGVVLASALFILPGAAARMLSDRMHVVMFLSAILSAIGMVVGLLITIHAGFLDAGAVIVLTLCGLFLLSYAAGALRRRRA